MIDLTPLDVRNKRGDFKKIMRGYDPQEVDVFLELVAERLEMLVRETLSLRERTQSLEEQVAQQADRERAVQDALVTAQGLRADIEAQSQREAEHIIREAQGEAKQLQTSAEAEVRRMLLEADEEVRNRVRGIERRVDQASASLEELERGRLRFLKEFASLLDREREVVRVELERTPFDERTIDMDLGGRVGVAAAGVSTLGARTSDVTDPDAVDPALEPLVDQLDGEDDDGEGVAADELEGGDGGEVIEAAEAAAGDQAAAGDEAAAADDADTDPGVGADGESVVVMADAGDAEEGAATGIAEVDAAGEADTDADSAEVVFEPGLPLREVLPDSSAEAAPGTESDDEMPDATMPDARVPDATVPDASMPGDTMPGDAMAASAPIDESVSSAPTLEELKAEMEATLGLGVTAVALDQDEAAPRADTAAAPPPLPETPEADDLVDDGSAEAAQTTVLETGPVDPTPATWSEPVSTLELAPDTPEDAAAPAASSDLGLRTSETPVDVTSLSPEPPTLEGGLAALDTRGSRGAGPFEGVPDLETVLAEAGIEEVVPPPLDERASRSIGGERDNMLLFEPEDHERGR